jgi:hypothetical protein
MAEEFIPLARAAALAHDRLFPHDGAKDAKTLDVVALALSTLIQLYVRDAEGDGALRALTKEEIATGRFTRGAMRLEFAGRAPLRFLLVSRRELYPAIDGLAKDPTCPLLKLCRRAQPTGHSSATGA